MVKGNSEPMITVHRTCMFCGDKSEVTLPLKAFDLWKDGHHIQTVWPEGTAAEREILISGTHDECFEAAFGEDD